MNSSNDTKKFDSLLDILLQEERVNNKMFQEELLQTKSQLISLLTLVEKVEPQIDTKVNHIKQEIDANYDANVIKSIKKQLEKSKDEIVDILYPVIGKLIGKYIQVEFQKLNDKINQKIETAFSFQLFAIRLKSKLLGVEKSEMILTQIKNTQIEEFFLIEKDSGILIDSYSKNKIVDQDLVAGMLTAIKSFIEDAFNKFENLDCIAYGSYEISIYTFHNFYLAITCKGIFSGLHREKLLNQVIEFSHLYVAKNHNNLSFQQMILQSFSISTNDIE